jgi:hypothetical protein
MPLSALGALDAPFPANRSKIDNSSRRKPGAVDMERAKTDLQEHLAAEHGLHLGVDQSSDLHFFQFIGERLQD